MAYFKKVVQGTFHQGDVRFGETAGRQCSCCALYSVCFLLVKSPGKWVGSDLDFIVSEGDKLYKEKNTSEYLMASELPQKAYFLNFEIKVNYSENLFGFLSYGQLRFLPVDCFEEMSGLILFFKGICLSLIKKRNNYFLFDSHSKDQNGFCCPNGKSILLKFDSRRSLEFHILTVYLTTEDINIQFEVQKVIVEKYEASDDYASAWRRSYKASLRNEKTSIQVNECSSKRKKSCNVSDKRKKAKTAAPINPDCENLFQYSSSSRGSSNCATVSHNCIQAFEKKIKEGPFFVCVVCHRSLYKISTKIFNPHKCENLQYIVRLVTSFDGKHYICLTCNKYVLKDKIPCQAVWNKLEIFPVPDELKVLNKLEKVLISKRILFKKIALMHKGNQPKIHGAVCNVPIRADKVSECLPHGSDSSGLIFVKLKRKLAYRGHVIFDKVDPIKVKSALNHLKSSNPFYSSILITIDNISTDLLCLTDIDALVKKDEISISNENENLEQESEDSLNLNRASCDETYIIPNVFNSSQGVLDIAPGEGKQPQSFFSDVYCEEQAFPVLFPTGKFGYQVEREVPLTPTKYFNQRLLHHSQRFASNSDYIFFAHYILQQKSLFDQINVATRKVKGVVRAQALQNNFEETVRQFVCEDQAYIFMKTVKGSPAYWKNFLYDVLAMIKQLGLPTFFLTLSCADLRWDELIDIITKLNGLKKSNLDYQKKCEILNQNPVLTARHFQYRVELFFKEILLNRNSPIGQVVNYAIKVEFQLRGSPHIHAFLWTEPSPILTKDNMKEYIDFIERTIRVDVPDDVLEPHLNELVSQYQTHKHSQTCRKYKNKPCRFNFGKFFSNRTIISQPLPDEMEAQEKLNLLTQTKDVLCKVKSYIDEYLDPHGKNYVSDITIPEILKSLGILEQDYYQALSISPDEDFHIHYYRPPNSCFINNYFPVGLMAWKANLDIQPVFNYFKAISYMCSYFSKTETEASAAIKLASKESNCSSYKEKMKNIALAFLSHRQCSVQEAIYQMMPELWLRKTFPGTIFANTNLPDKRYKFCKSQKELSELPADSTEVFKRNMLDRYIDRPNKTFKQGKFSMVDELCFAEFVSMYVLKPKTNTDDLNDSQPVNLNDDSQNDLFSLYPKTLPLMSSKELLNRRNKRLIVRYHTPNKFSNPEAYAHHILLLFYPFRNETELICPSNNTYNSFLLKENVIEIVNRNKQIFEPFGELLDTLVLNYSRINSQDDTESVRNDLCDDSDHIHDMSIDDPPPMSNNSIPTPRINLMPDININELIASLNYNQRQVFDYTFQWAKTLIKNRNSDIVEKNAPLQLFITGGAGTGKSHLIKTIYAAVSKILAYGSSVLEKESVLLLAPTGVAAVNINGNTIHSGLGIPTDCKGDTVPKLSDKKRCQLRVELQEVKMIIIDEVSMISNNLLLFIHQRLVEIFGCTGDFNKPFAGVSVILVGDLYQLPPVLQKPVFSEYPNELLNINMLWRNFKMCELTEVMRQKGDAPFIDLLNNIRVGTVTIDDELMLKSRTIEPTDVAYPKEALHIFAENEPARIHNSQMLSNITGALHNLTAIDNVPRNVPTSVYDRILNLNPSKTGGLAYNIPVKKGAIVMLTSNVDIKDRLINGQIGKVIDFALNNDGTVKTVFVKFNDEHAGKGRLQANVQARHLNAVPIERISFDIRVSEKKDSSLKIQRYQFPLLLSWGCTIHKVQGLSLDQAVVSLNLQKQRKFNHGQLYVAFSRVTSLNGLFLLGNLSIDLVSASDKVVEEYNYLRTNQLFTFERYQRNQSELLSFTLCNVRSLRTHIKDIKSDCVMTASDYIFCTETQLLENSDNDDLKIDGYNLITNNFSRNRYKNTAVYFKESLNVSLQFQCEGFAILILEPKKLFEIPLTVMLVYKEIGLSFQEFFEPLQYLAVSWSVDIILGDFNTKPSDVTNLLLDYIQLVSHSTHISGSILDQVYVKKELSELFKFETTIKCLFFSDHDLVVTNVSPY